MAPGQRVSALRGWLALSPLILFLLLYLVTSLAIGDFYKMPVTVAFLVSAVYAVIITRGDSLQERIALFSKGAANTNILLMIWIFILAGAFSAAAGSIGCIDATVGLVLRFLPASMVPAGLFAGACFISLSIGTSVGTVVALVPMAAGIAESTGAAPGMMTAIVVGGAFFGDNLSFISDTTIAATRTQGCAPAQKFRANLRIVLPAALCVLCYYIYFGLNSEMTPVESAPVDYMLVIPYLIVLGGALAGINVAAVLVAGILSVAALDLLTGLSDPLALAGAMGAGISGMSDLVIVTLLAGGLLELIRHNGGIDFILQSLTRHISGRRGAAASIAALVSLANICTANNTIAILTVGRLSADISSRYRLEAKRAASILDTFSCITQGVLPYGAQLLMAGSLAAMSPLGIIRYLYYPMVLLIFSMSAIALLPNKK